MADQRDGTEVPLNEMSIPHYSRRFDCLRDILKPHRDTVDQQTVQWQAQWGALDGGIQYYYKIIEEVQNTGEKRNLCHSLVESMNRAIYCLIDTKYISRRKPDKDESDQTEDMNKCLCAYMEYLQWICNIDMDEENRKNNQRLIIKVSLDLLKDKVCMETLFPRIHGFNKKMKTVPSLCVVFCPSDEGLDRVYKYLPMLTHEISHHFRYIELNKRNEFLLGYLLDELCAFMVISLFQEVSEKGRRMIPNGAEPMLAAVMSKKLQMCFLKKYDKFIEEVHLIQIKDYLYQFFGDMIGKDEASDTIFSKGDPQFLILKEAFCGLAFVTDMSWYVSGKYKDDYAEEELLLSMVMDILCLWDGNRDDELKWTSDVKVSGKYRGVIARLIEGNKGAEHTCILTKEALNTALGLLVLKVSKAVDRKFRRKGENPEIERARREVYRGWLCDYCEFQEKLEEICRLMTSKDDRDFYSFFDMCVTIKNHIDHILCICNGDGEVFEQKKTVYPILTEVFESLRDKIRTELASKRRVPTLEKAYWSNRMIYSEIVQMGLLDEQAGRYIYFGVSKAV